MSTRRVRHLPKVAECDVQKASLQKGVGPWWLETADNLLFHQLHRDLIFSDILLLVLYHSVTECVLNHWWTLNQSWVSWSMKSLDLSINIVMIRSASLLGRIKSVNICNSFA